MGNVELYTQEMINAYVERGYWTRDLTVNFWEKNAVLYPDKEAISDSKFRMTWSEGLRTIDRLMTTFLSHGLKKDDVLLCQLYNSVLLTFVRLACEKAGIVIALIPTTFRESEVAGVLGHTQSKGAVFASRFREFDYMGMYSGLQQRYHHLKKLFVIGEEMSPETISLNDIMTAKSGAPDKEDAPKRQGFGPFEYTEIVTTSGSTGIPKCVQFTACARLSTGRDYIKRFQLTDQDVIAIFSSSISGSAETLIHRCPPQLGARMVMLEHFTPEEACELIEKEGITVAGAVPTLVVRLMNFPGLGDFDLSSLRSILVSGGLLTYEQGREAESRLGCKVIQGYGGMDVGAVSVGDVTSSQEIRLKTLGRPLSGNEVMLVDPYTGDEVRSGEVGMVTLDGPHCFGGYYRDPVATGKLRINGKFNMGDLGYFDDEGNIVLRGRVKEVIKRGGQSIYPKEVEELLVQHPSVSEVALVRMPDREMGEKACAFVVLKKGRTLTFEEMVFFFKARQVAPYKIPERLELAVQIPLVPGGNKVDKRQLEDLLKEKLKS